MITRFTPEQWKKILVGGKFLKTEEFTSAAAQAERSGITIGESVVDLGFLSDVQIGRLVADELGLTFLDLSKEHVDGGALGTLSEAVSTGQECVIYKRTNDHLFIATSHPDNYEFFKLLEKRFGLSLDIAYTTPAGIKNALKGFKKDLLLQLHALIDQMKKSQHEEDIVHLVQFLLTSAFEGRASDIHIEPEDKEAVVRFRIDGSMVEVVRYPIDFHEKLVFRIKILSRMRTDEHAQAQDGRFDVTINNIPLNLRVSILPITHGENVVMRLLSENFQRLRLEDLGLQEDDYEKIRRAADLPHGMILAAGPTGSGKTTTLYAIIHILNQPDINLMTIEDPVEYNIKGIRQIQVNPRTNLTFDAGLRSIVRQDPDVIMVGEVRDAETADIAINAALTGHLLLTTLHANDAATVFPRLFEMNIEPFLIASSLNVIMAQRLVRHVCPQCVSSYFPDPEEVEMIERDPKLLKIVLSNGGEKSLKKIRFYKGMGCPVCSHTGYVGRLGLFEILEVTEAIRPLIINKSNSEDIRDKAITLGMRTMIEDGVMKVFQGKTTISEVIRATKS